MPDDFFRSFKQPAPKHSSEAEFIMEQLARLPTRRELAWFALVILFVGAMLGIVATEAFWHYLPSCG
jgi:hypothetical protein